MMDNVLDYKILKQAISHFKGSEDVKEADIINAYNMEGLTSFATYDFNSLFEKLLSIDAYYTHEEYLRNEVNSKLCDENFVGAKQLVNIMEDYCSYKDFKYYKSNNVSNTPLTYNDLLEKIKEKYG